MINIKEFLKEGEATLELGEKFSYSLAYLATNFNQKELKELIDTNPEIAKLNEKFEDLGQRLGMGYKKQ